METPNIIAIILFPVLVLIFGSLGGIITSKKIPGWYNPLKKPKFNPPNWIFGPVWTLLYISIGFSGYIFWDTKKGFYEEDTAHWFFYFFQIFLNLIWTPIFFGLNYTLLAFGNICLMVVAVLVNIILFSQKSTLAGCILIPYLCWISFATYLNFGIWYLNRGNQRDEYNISAKEIKEEKLEIRSENNIVN